MSAMTVADNSAGSSAKVTGGAASTRVADVDGAEDVVAEISLMRDRINEIDAAIMELWQERAALSRRVGATRVASGGTRLVLAREREILDRFRAALGADGTQLALLILRAGRGPL